MSAEKFCLRWNDFETNISVAFKELREEKDFFDVTLACEENQVKAHKVILSACSPFFRSVLRTNPHQHPLLYLKGVRYQDLLAVLSFMYNGEVNVAQEELNTFLTVAEDLRVKGLTQNTTAEHQKKTTTPPPQESVRQFQRPREPPERETLPIKRPRPAPPISNPVKGYTQQQQHYDEDITEVVPVKSEPRDPLPQPQQSLEEDDNTGYAQSSQEMVVEQHVAIQDNVEHGAVALDQSYGDDGYGYDDYGDGYNNSVMMNTSEMGAGMSGTDANKDEALISSKMTKFHDGVASIWQCIECAYTSKLRHNMRNHIESQHTASQGYFCHHCDKFCKTKNALSLHKSRSKHY